MVAITAVAFLIAIYLHPVTRRVRATDQAGAGKIRSWRRSRSCYREFR